MKATINEINLLPKEYIQAQKNKIYLLFVAAAVILECLFFTITVVLPPIAAVKNQESLLMELKIKLEDPKYAVVNQIMETLRLAEEDIQKWENKCAWLKKDRFITNQLLDEVIGQLPEGVTIDQLEIKAQNPQDIEEGASIMIKGKTQVSTDVLNYTAALESIYHTASMRYHIGNRESERIYQPFDITITMPFAKQIEQEAEKEGQNETDLVEASGVQEVAADRGGLQ